METLINELHQNLINKSYYSSLILALLIPDICGAIQSEEGTASSEKYTKWFDKYVSPSYRNIQITGYDIYKTRCAILHQGKMNHDKVKHNKVYFYSPNHTVLNSHVDNDLGLDLRIFIQNIIKGFSTWQDEYKNDKNYKKNIQNTVKYYMNGFENIDNGLPIIG